METECEIESQNKLESKIENQTDFKSVCTSHQLYTVQSRVRTAV